MNKEQTKRDLMMFWWMMWFIVTNVHIAAVLVSIGSADDHREQLTAALNGTVYRTFYACVDGCVYADEAGDQCVTRCQADYLPVNDFKSVCYEHYGCET